MTHLEYKTQHYYNWEYYASQMPIWKRRIEQFNGKVCKYSKKIIFENDDNLEQFYELYGYDFDEQSLQIQELSLLEIKKKDSMNWIYKLYGEQKQNKQDEQDEQCEQCEQCETSKPSLDMDISIDCIDKDILNIFQEIPGLII
jgi:hypothetical protein